MSVYGMKLINEESVSCTTATPSVDIGTVRFHGGIQYMYMYNAGGEGYKGAPCWVTATSAMDFVTTYATFAALSAAGADGFAFAGVLHNATCAAGSYAWVAQRGLLNCRPSSSAIAAGDAVIAGDDGNWVQSRTGVTETSTIYQIASYIVNTVVGQAMEAATAAATGTIKVYVR